MDLSIFFQLEGRGYLENVSRRRNKCIANIKVIHPFQQEDISLECEVQEFLKKYVLNLGKEVKKGNSISMFFKAIYCTFKTAFSCSDAEGEDSGGQIIVLGCKLSSVGECYINGRSVNKHYPYLAAA